MFQPNCTGTPDIETVIANTKSEQEEGIYDIACAEIASGQKRKHWMWYIFPSICTVWGHSKPHVNLPSVLSLNDYLDDEVLGARLIYITQLALDQLEKGVSSRVLMGSPVDDQKFHLTMTAGYLVSNYFDRPEAPLFANVLKVLGKGLFPQVVDMFNLEVAQLQGKKKQGGKAATGGQQTKTQLLRLMQFGVSQQKARKTLQTATGDFDMAYAMLLSQGYTIGSGSTKQQGQK
jgi:uncharacterized protein (DUF1810 family)